MRPVVLKNRSCSMSAVMDQLPGPNREIPGADLFDRRYVTVSTSGIVLWGKAQVPFGESFTPYLLEVLSGNVAPIDQTATDSLRGSA
jgi:hypothetical protein